MPWNLSKLYMLPLCELPGTENDFLMSFPETEKVKISMLVNKPFYKSGYLQFYKLNKIEGKPN